MRLKSFILCLGAALVAAPAVHAHGGTYVGPGDVTPPGGSPPPGQPTPPGGTPGKPTTPSGPSLPGTPGAPALPGLPNPNPTPRGTPPVTGGSVDVATEGSDWRFWWELNKHRYLHLRAKVQGADPFTESPSVIDALGSGAGVHRSNAPTDLQLRDRILPALLAAAEEPDQDLRSGALMALARIGREDGRVGALLREALAAPLQEISETAALALGVLADPAALDAVLAPLAWDAAEGRALVRRAAVPMRTRAFATYAAARIGARAADPATTERVLRLLIDLLEQDRSAAADLRLAAAVGLGTLRPGDPAAAEAALTRVEALLAAQRDDRLVLAHLRTASAKVLLGLPASERALRDRVLAQTLPLLGRRSRADALQQESAAIALGLLARPQDPRSAEIFTALCESATEAKDEQARRFSLMALADLGAADPAFDAPARRAPVTRFLLARLQRDTGGMDAWAGLALGVMAFERAERGVATDAAAVQELAERFANARSGATRAAFALALGLARHVESIPTIAAALREGSDPDFLGYCAVALGLLEARAEAPLLMERMERHRRDPAVLQQAVIGLALMRHREGLDRMLEWLNPAMGRPTLAVLAATATGIGFVGDARSVEPLIQAMADPRRTPLGRAFAAVALGLVADRDLLPWHAAFSADLNYRAALPTLVDRSLGAGLLDLL